MAARCEGTSQPEAAQPGFAQTSPVYVEVEGRPFQPDAAVIDSLTDHLERLADWARAAARCPTEHQRENLLSLFASAREILRRKRPNGK